MKHTILLLFLFLLPGALATAGYSPEYASDPPTVTDHAPQIEFPNSVTFEVTIESPETVSRVVLEYGVDQLTCGAVTAQAFPEFEEGTSADVSWTWDMRKSGSLAPGSTLWYRWRATDKAGNETISERESLTWIDSVHKWNSLSEANLTLHWYTGGKAFAGELLQSAYSSLIRLKETTGVALDEPINIYIYADAVDMGDAILYEPSWTGGVAFASQNIVILGILPSEVVWGRSSLAHELTHVLVGHLAFTCLASIPTWLNEGIAVYGEGGLDAQADAIFQEAVQSDSLLSVRSLSGQFSESPSKANLSYSQSYSLVNYLIAEFGKDKILSLFRTLAEGVAIEESMQAVYGFGLDQFEAAWRASIGAPPRTDIASESSETALPTVVPTYSLPGAPTSLPPVPTRTAIVSPVEQGAEPSETDKRAIPPALWAALVLFPVITGLTSGLIFSRRKRR